jgi:hypothetical protein
MLRLRRETLCWHGRAEGTYPPSDTLSLHDFLVSSNNLFILLNRSNTADFCFVLGSYPASLQRHIPKGSNIGITDSYVHLLV